MRGSGRHGRNGASPRSCGGNSRSQAELRQVKPKKKKASLFEAKENLSLRMGFKQVISKEKVDDIFKDIIQDQTQEILIEDISKWV